MRPRKFRVYKHYKGNFYKIIDIAEHSETGEELVIYVNTDKNKPQVWARPLEMFTSKVELESGKIVDRYKYLGK